VTLLCFFGDSFLTQNNNCCSQKIEKSNRDEKGSTEASNKAPQMEQTAVIAPPLPLLVLSFN